MVLEYAKRHAERVFGVSDVAYDLLATMARKLDGIDALEEYILDAGQAGDQEVMALFERLERRAQEDVDQVYAALVARLQADEERNFDTVAVTQDELGD